jgi:ATP-dependent RNA helicase DDX24/MAK5
VAPSDDKNYSRIVQALKAKIQTVHLDGRLLRAAQERVNLACKVVSAEGEERKVQREKKWFHEQADEAGLEVDESLIETSESANRSRQGNVRRARAELAQLLSQPMQTQRYGKFLSTNSSRTTAAIPASVNPNSHTRRRKSG